MKINISKNSSLLIFLLFFNTANLHSQTIQVSGSITSNTNWSADTVKIIGDVTVPAGVRLTVNPGTYVEAQGYFKISISGEIRAIGTPTDTIVFTVHNSTNFWQDTTSVAGGWAGFEITNIIASADSSIFKFCKIEYGKKYEENGGNINGGAICATDYGTLVIENSLLTCNMVICYKYGPKGGGVYCKNVTRVMIENNRCERNRSFSYGGAIYVGELCQSFISYNTFIDNKAIKWSINLFVSGCGAAICTSDAFISSPTITNNYCFNNQSINGIIYTSNRNGLIFNNLICNNFGTGITDGHQLSTSRIYNNTIVNNTGYGGIELFSKAKVYNNICWGNEPYPSQGIDQIYIDAISKPQLFNNCVQYGNGGANSTNQYPEFLLPTDGAGLAFDGSEAYWSLKNSSPCINHVTSDTTGLFLPKYDIEGNPRLYGVGIDMGCYENQYVFVGLEDENIIADKILLFPNPGSDYLILQSGPQITGAEFTLYDMQGKPVLHEKINTTQLRLNTSNLPAGIYPWQIIFKNKVIESGKWVKE